MLKVDHGEEGGLDSAGNFYLWISRRWDAAGELFSS